MKRMHSPRAAMLRLTLTAAIMAGAAGVAVPAANAQTSDSGAAAPAAPANSGSSLFAGGWRKVAVPNPQDQSKPVTLVTQEARDKNNVPIAEVTIMIEPDGSKRMLVVVPQGFLLPPASACRSTRTRPFPASTSPAPPIPARPKPRSRTISSPR